MREQVIRILRDCACVRGKQKTLVSTLSDDQLYELFLRLRNQETAKSIARYIQQAWGVKPNSSVHSVSQGILKFKRRIAHLLLAPDSHSSINPNKTGLEDIVELEGPEGIERIVQLQRARIERMMNEEQETGIKQNVSREIQALSGLIKTLMKSKEFDMMHKGNDPLKRRRFERMKKRLANRFSHLVDFSDEGDRFLKATQRFLELAEKNAVDIKIDAEGEIHLAEPRVGSHKTG